MTVYLNEVFLMVPGESECLSCWCQAASPGIC